MICLSKTNPLSTQAHTSSIMYKTTLIISLPRLFTNMHTNLTSFHNFHGLKWYNFWLSAVWDPHISDQKDCENDENLSNLCQYYWKTLANSLLCCNLQLIDDVYARRNRGFVLGMQIIEKLPKLVNKSALIIYVAKFDYVKKRSFWTKNYFTAHIWSISIKYS